MNKETYDKYHRSLLRKASDVRSKKEAEYFSEDDLLANFRVIAGFRRTSTPEAIMNLGIKSIQSISDMVNFEFFDPHPDETSTLEQWDEKFTNAINYLIKLYAAIREARE